MSNLMKGKKYGLSLPKSSQVEASRSNPMDNSAMVARSNVFGDDDSESLGSGDDDWVKQSLKAKAAKSSGLKKQTKLLMAKALEEDPTVYQYDEVYDKIEENKVEKEAAKKDVDRKPKYIKQLIKTADVRKKEHERRVERQVQKERELEGEEFKDKESFVTSAFRKKMEEMAKEEEEEKRQDSIEAALDVRKQGDMSGFYRHIYRQTMGEEKGQGVETVKEESVESDSGKKKNENELCVKKINKKNREYRKRDNDENNEEGSEESSSGTSDESDQEDRVKKVDETKERGDEDKKEKRMELIEQKEKRERRKRKIEQDESSSESDDESNDKSKSKVSKNETALGDKRDEALPVEEEKPKIDIWKKRTVGEVFEAAVQRFWQRKAERESRQS